MGDVPLDRRMWSGMSEASRITAALDAIAQETNAAFDWLAADLDPDRPVSFVPNPGNLGDAAINLACWRFLAVRFRDVEMCPLTRAPSHSRVFIGGGGNLVEGLYDNLERFIAAHTTGREWFVFPSTIVGNAAFLERIAERAKIICREAVSLEHVRKHVPTARVTLGHDAAFSLAPWLRSRFAERMQIRPRQVGRLFRGDRESARPGPAAMDFMGSIRGDWDDAALAEEAVEVGSRFLLGFGAIHTDRLHGAILSALLHREVLFYPNSYFKNAAVFEHSLRRLPHVGFVDASEA